jgi:hypothetical protein
MAPDYRTVQNYRHLRLVWERQAVAPSNEEARKALEDMAKEYRKMAEEYRKVAEVLERKLQERSVPFGSPHY